MKNSIIQLTAKLTLCLPIILAGTAVCYAEPAVTGSAVIPLNTVFIKFGITMGAVLISLLIIWSGLYSFKKFTAKSIKEYKQQALYGDNFNTATNMDDAIVSFIEKNRL